MTLDELIQYIVVPTQLAPESLPDPTWALVIGLVLAIAAGVPFAWLAKRKLVTEAEFARYQREPAIRASDAGLLVGLYLIILIVGGILIHSIGWAGAGVDIESKHKGLMLISVVSCAIPLIFLKLRTLLHQGSKASFTPTRRGAPWLMILVIFALWIPFSIGIGLINTWLVEAFHLEAETQAVLADLTQPSRFQIPAMLLTAVIAAPIVEEFVLRSGLQAGLTWFGRVPALILATLAFTMLHGVHAQPHVFLPVFALGFALAWVYDCTRNVWYPIALHALHNGATLLFALYAN